MPLPFSIDPAAGLIRCHLDGDTPAAQLAESLDGVLAEPQFRPGLGFLDLHRRGIGLTAARIREVAALIRAAAPRVAPCRWAVVVNTEADFPAVRVLALLTRKSGVTVAPFTNLPRRAVGEGRLPAVTAPGAAEFAESFHPPQTAHPSIRPTPADRACPAQSGR